MIMHSHLLGLNGEAAAGDRRRRRRNVAGVMPQPSPSPSPLFYKSMVGEEAEETLLRPLPWSLF